MENFLLPSKVEFEKGEGENTSRVIISPCYHGYGTTLGNALRRVLLSSLPGAAVEYFKIKGVQHEFSTVEGVKEDAVEIMLNLKQLAVRVFSEELVTLVINKKTPGVVTAGDIEPNAQVEIMNKKAVICTLTKNKALEMEIVVGRGRGYIPVEEKNRKNYALGTIVVDSVYTPVKDVGYHVENTRVGDITNYEKVSLYIETNGTITPDEALRQATQILMDHFTVILDAAVGNEGNEKIVMIAEKDEVVGESEATGTDEGDGESDAKTLKTENNESEEKAVKKNTKAKKKAKK